MRFFSIRTQIFYCWGVFSIKSGEDVLFPILARLFVMYCIYRHSGSFSHPRGKPIAFVSMDGYINRRFASKVAPPSFFSLPF